MERVREVWPDVAGKTVLDIGCSEGFFAFLAEEQGAKSVLAVDPEPENIRRALEAATRRGSKIPIREVSIYNLPALQGIRHMRHSYDVVLFLGVIYHLQDPMSALRNVAELVAPQGVAVIESHLWHGDETQPLMRFWPGDSLNGDASNWWSPNVACMEAMLAAVGFEIEARHFVPAIDRGAWRVRKARGTQ